MTGPNPTDLSQIHDLRRRAASGDRQTLRDLATALQRASIDLIEAGDNYGADALMDELIAVGSRLASEDPATFLPKLAGALLNRVLHAYSRGRDAGRVAIKESVATYGRLAAVDWVAHLPVLADMLAELVDERRRDGDRLGALDAMDAVVVVYTDLARMAPAQFRSEQIRALSGLAGAAEQAGDQDKLAKVLADLAVLRAAVGDAPGALAAVEEAATIRRRQAEADPAFVEDLVDALFAQVFHRCRLGDRAGARSAFDEAGPLLHRLPVTSLPKAAQALPAIALDLARAGDLAAGVTAAREAVETSRRLADADPDAYVPMLAGALRVAAGLLNELGDGSRAATMIGEADVLDARLAEGWPLALPADVRELFTQVMRRVRAGDGTAARSTLAQAIFIIRQLPSVSLEHAGQALERLAGQLELARDGGAASVARSEAAASRQRLRADPQYSH